MTLRSKAAVGLARMIDELELQALDHELFARQGGPSAEYHRLCARRCREKIQDLRFAVGVLTPKREAA